MSILKNISTFMFYHAPRTGCSAMKVSKFKAPYVAKEELIEGFKLLTVSKEDSGKGHFYFMHGGAYTLEPVGFHRKILLNLVDLGYKVTYIDYPLWPEYTADKTNEITLAGFKKIAADYPEDEFYFIGDSAGGGLAVSILMQLRDEGFSKLPSKTLLLSPWLDVTESNEKISEYDKLDKTLSAKALKDIGTKFAGPLGSAHPFVSPIYGNLENLGSFFVFYSDSELMFPDVQKFIELIEKANGSSIQSYVEKNAPHDYLMSSTKEKNAEYYSLIQEFITK